MTRGPVEGELVVLCEHFELRDEMIVVPPGSHAWECTEKMKCLDCGDIYPKWALLCPECAAHKFPELGKPFEMPMGHGEWYGPSPAMEFVQ